MTAARRGDCVKAVPLLEEAELVRHRPTSGLALADCYVALGELLNASELYEAIAAEKPARGYTFADRLAIQKAKKKAAAVDARIPRLAFTLDEPYEGLEVEIDGREIEDPEEPRKVPPDVQLVVTARAEGYEELTEKLVMNEGERRTLRLKLKALPKATPPGRRPPAAKKAPDGPTTWLGAGYQGFIIPKFVWGAFGEGGRSIFAPGGALSLTTRVSDVDVVVSGAYESFRLVETPFKPNGRPDTDYEIIESDLQALMASVHLLWELPLDDAGTFSFRIGGGVGIGWTFLGNLYRTQAYPPDGAGGNPYLYKKCRGPNRPSGTFRYCNQLDHDADRYNGYAEPSWFSGGARPLIYPWAVLPQLGLSFRPARAFAVDLQVGLSMTGLLTGLGVRFGL